MNRTVCAAPQFRRLFAAQTVSRWGDTFNAVALVILVYRLTGSGLRVAGTVAFEIAPVLVFGPIAGAVADRFAKKRVMVGADLVRAALATFIALAPRSLVLIYAIAFGLSAGSVFFNPASGALLPALVNEDQLVSANSSLWSAAVISQIALAPAAGLLVATAGARPPFAINAASFLVSAALLTGITRDTRTPDRAGWARQIAGGFELVKRERMVRLLVVVQALAALSAGATSALLVVLAQRRLGVGASGRRGTVCCSRPSAWEPPPDRWRCPGCPATKCSRGPSSVPTSSEGPSTSRSRRREASSSQHRPWPYTG